MLKQELLVWPHRCKLLKYQEQEYRRGEGMQKFGNRAAELICGAPLKLSLLEWGCCLQRKGTRRAGFWLDGLGLRVLAHLLNLGDQALRQLCVRHLAHEIVGHVRLQAHLGRTARNRHLVNLVLQLHQAIEELLRTRRAAKNVDVDRDDLVHALQHGVAVERPSHGGAASHGNHPLRVGHLRVDALHYGRHLQGDGAGDDHQVGLARAGAKDLRAEARDIEARGGRGDHLDGAAGQAKRHGPDGGLPRPVENVVHRADHQVLFKTVVDPAHRTPSVPSFFPGWRRKKRAAEPGAPYGFEAIHKRAPSCPSEPTAGSLGTPLAEPKSSALAISTKPPACSSCRCKLSSPRPARKHSRPPETNTRCASRSIASWLPPLEKLSSEKIPSKNSSRHGISSAAPTAKSTLSESRASALAWAIRSCEMSRPAAIPVAPETA